MDGLQENEVEVYWLLNTYMRPERARTLHALHYLKTCYRTLISVTYVSGALRSSTASTRNRPTVLRLRRAPPLYPSSIWNMHEATLQQQERTNNVCEGWNNSFASLVDRNHPSIWTLLQSLQQGSGSNWYAPGRPGPTVEQTLQTIDRAARTASVSPVLWQAWW